MLNQFKRWGGFAVVAILLASCATTAYVEKDDSADFTRYRTFAWIDKDGEGKNDRNRSNDLAEQKIQDAVTKELEKTAGWKLSNNRPDVLLSYDVLVEKSIQELNDPVYSRPVTRVFFNRFTRRYNTIYYPSQFMGYNRDQRSVREGTVTITMVDAKSDRTVWQGWSTDQVNNSNLTNREIQNAVKSIFRKFDVAKN